MLKKERSSPHKNRLKVNTTSIWTISTSFSCSIFMILNITIYWCPFRFLKRRLVLFYYFYTENSGWKLWMTLLTKDWICWPLFVRSGHSFYYSTLFLTLRKWFDVAMATPIASMGGELNRSMFDLSFCLNDDLIPYCTQYYYHDTFKIIWSAFISLGNVRLRP